MELFTNNCIALYGYKCVVGVVLSQGNTLDSCSISTNTGQSEGASDISTIICGDYSVVLARENLWTEVVVTRTTHNTSEVSIVCYNALEGYRAIVHRVVNIRVDSTLIALGKNIYHSNYTTAVNRSRCCVVLYLQDINCCIVYTAVDYTSEELTNQCAISDTSLCWSISLVINGESTANRTILNLWRYSVSGCDCASQSTASRAVVC